MFIDNLIYQIKRKRSPIVVGLDPHLDLIPEFIKDKYFEEYGNTFKAVKNIILEFNKEIIDNIYDIVPAVKPQIAFYEQYGIEGLEAYIDTCEYAKGKGLLIIGDVKRGDIGSTSRAYSSAHLGKTIVNGDNISSFTVDSITINPYLGEDCIKEFIKDVRNYNKGIFVLVKTSNPTSCQIQNLEVGDKKVYEIVAQIVKRWNREAVGKYGYSSIGAVVGANSTEEMIKLRDLLKKSYFLIPGYGVQGGKAMDTINGFNEDGLGAIINSARGILYTYINKKTSSYGLAAREETIIMRDNINKVLLEHNKGKEWL